MYEMRRGLKRAVEAGDVPRLLRNPFRVRMRRRACDEDSACPDVDEEMVTTSLIRLPSARAFSTRRIRIPSVNFGRLPSFSSCFR